MTSPDQREERGSAMSWTRARLRVITMTATSPKSLYWNRRPPRASAKVEATAGPGALTPGVGRRHHGAALGDRALGLVHSVAIDTTPIDLRTGHLLPREREPHRNDAARSARKRLASRPPSKMSKRCRTSSRWNALYLEGQASNDNAKTHRHFYELASAESTQQIH
jgi:hypothetical protein